MHADNHEDDYPSLARRTDAGTFLPGTSIEIVAQPPRNQPPEHVVFDFDGTLSLIREGWSDVMIPMLVDELQATGTDESADELRDQVRRFVAELTGKQTIYQMIRLADEVRRRGGTPRDPVEYKQIYHQRLMDRIGGRREALRAGRAQPDDMLVPGTRELLDALQRRGAALYLASGTDRPFVLEECGLLGLEEYFGPRIYGAIDDYKQFSKAKVIAAILSEHEVAGEALLGFGDGYVEIQNVKQAGGVAVGVASDEAGRSGRPDAWKRERLIGVGADLIIPDFRDHEVLLAYLWGEMMP